jgi:DNA replicative helicase MCM subunit Mcm2 (Cdc46/Mcm family)
VKKEDAEDILKLAEEFLEAIYVTPKIAEEQAKLRAPKKKSSQHQPAQST